MTGTTPQERRAAVAIVGMAGRFPDAPTIELFWENLTAGVRSIRSFSTEEVLAAGADPILRAPAQLRQGRDDRRGN